MKQLSNLALDKNRIRTLSEFKKEALKIHEKYNVRYLGAEFNTLVATGQMTRRYWEVIADADIFPLLEWDAVNDDRTRAEHARLDGIRLPARDTFWHRYWAPLDIGCRCEVNQARSGRITPRANAIQLAKTAVGRKSPFFGNAAVDGMPIKKDHSYFAKADYSNLKAVKDYGLKPAEKIYAKPNLPAPNRALTDKASWFKKWAELYQQHKGTDGKFTISDALDRPITFDSRARDQIKRYNLGGDILDVLQNPDEIYSQDHQGKKRGTKMSYRYIKFFQDKPVQVVVEPDGKSMRLVNVIDISMNQIDNKRKGVLHLVDRP